jgi:RNA polymerase sigma-70 factor (ECF subfamily)
MDEKNLITSLKQADPSAFDELIRRYSPKVYNLAKRMTRSAEDAEEICQDVFLSVYHNIKDFKGDSAFSTWLYSITANACKMKLRKRKPEELLTTEGDLPELPEEYYQIATVAYRSENPDRALLNQERNTRLEEAIAQLPPDHRQVLILRDIEGLPAEEVGKILNLSVPNVKVRLHRSRLMLRKQLEKYFNV